MKFGCTTVLVCCLIQALTWSTEFVSAYPQPINVPKDESSEDSGNGDGNKEVQVQPEVVEFQIHQNQIHEGDGEGEGVSDGDACLEKKRTGPCRAAIPKYYYNQGSGRCEVFLYGGCDGTNNRFDSLRDCEQKCATHLRPYEIILIHGEGDGYRPNQTQAEQLSSSVVTICEMPHTEEGVASCKGYVPRWTYNAASGKCVQFMFQGCGATKNNFASKTLCDKACGDYVFQKTNADLRSSPGPSEICKLPMNPGPCYALYDRYFFNQLNNRCEKFVFGGCSGNENNFKSADECVRTCGGDEPAEDASCATIECPWSRFSHYTALGCKPIYDSNSCCPTRFDCPDSNLTARTQTEPKCRYQGQLYSIGETIKDASSLKDCRASCTCLSVGKRAKIQCVNIECPEQLGVVPPGKESCHRLYKKGGCCVDSYYCPNDTRTDETSPLPPPPPVEPYECHFEGKTYFEGERIYPERQKCLKCACQKGFNGNLTDEFCDKVDCGIEIYYSDKLERGCAPVYFQDSNGVDSCCPISWKCPDEQKITLPIVPLPPRPSSELQPPLPGQGVPVPVRVPGPITILPIPIITGNNGNETQNQIHATTTSKKVDEITSEVCKLPGVTGPCRAHRPRFFFNTVTNKCENFTYGGCKGNQNNFVVLSDCQRICETSASTEDQEQDVEEGTTQTSQIMSRAGGQVQIQPVPVREPTPTTYKLTETDPCEQSVRTGPCRAYIPRYYFSPEDNTCKFFVYGGCKGNENNFYSQASCEAKCLNRLPQESLRFEQSNALRSVTRALPDDSSRVTFENSQEQSSQQLPPHRQRPNGFKILDVTPVTEHVCNLTAETGRCRAHLKRFYFDGAQCSLFTYGGCGGNANNFRNFDECNTKCGGGSRFVGQQQQQILPANFKTAKWRSVGTGTAQAQVQPVVFGGTERCQLPPKVGSCYGYFKAYYYDVVSRSCQNFTYGGCFGNTNRFVSLEECKATCERPLELERQNELAFRRSGTTGGSDDAVAHILPVSQPDPEDDESQSQMVMGRQLLPGEVIVEPPTTPTSKTVVIKLESTADSDATDDVLEEKVFCGLAPEKGPCRGNQLRYFWESNSQTCLPFYYGGCSGNKNNFLDESDCLSVCGAGPTLEQMTQDGVLSCSFGNETFALGATLDQFISGAAAEVDNTDIDNDVNVEPCGVPICSCQTPPTLTCIQKACDRPAQMVVLPNRNGDNDNGNNEYDNDDPTTTVQPEFEIQPQRGSVPASRAASSSSPTPNWSKPVEKIVKG